jgi:hypothetical protein
MAIQADRFMTQFTPETFMETITHSLHMNHIPGQVTPDYLAGLTQAGNLQYVFSAGPSSCFVISAMKQLFQADASSDV